MASPLIQSWLKDLDHAWDYSSRDRPNYWAHDSSTLVTESHIDSLFLGTGHDVYRGLQADLDSTTHELILVTCFWARSETLQVISTVLRNLSAKTVKNGRSIRIRIYFSSSSIFQKLFHPWSSNGKIYGPESWSSTFGLPSAAELPGLDMEVKSIFFLPFSVMHPKFIIIDRHRVFLPSCNISWENWFEGCISLRGPVVQQALKFWQEFWASPGDQDFDSQSRFQVVMLSVSSGSEDTDTSAGQNEHMHVPTSHDSALTLPKQVSLGLQSVRTVFLPSPHHLNPRFRFPWQFAASPPPTPLNTFLLSSFRCARSSIYVQTPNLTSPPVLAALLFALRQGVNIHIVTSERLMILEQLVTAGTTTSRCVQALIRQFQQIRAEYARSSDYLRIEEGHPRPGNLRIEYFQPRIGHTGTGEPVQSHLKLTIVDDELVVLGSGNMDRASWYTSQELGMAFFSGQLARTVHNTVGDLLKQRKRVVFDGGTA